MVMRISEAARRLGTSARMLRYREDLGLLPQVRDPLPWPSQVPAHGPAHRQFSEADLEVVAAALELERRYDISPGISCSASWISLRPKAASERSATWYGS